MNKSLFYKSLYTSKLKDNIGTTTLTNKLLDTKHIPRLNQVNQLLCDSELSLYECSNPLKDLANNPGLDGLFLIFL